MILTWQSFFENDPFNSEGEILENEEDNSLNNASGRINNTITDLNASSISGPSIEFVEFSTEDVRFFLNEDNTSTSVRCPNISEISAK